jgi:hypothetical protein
MKPEGYNKIIFPPCCEYVPMCILTFISQLSLFRYPQSPSCSWLFEFS